MSVTILSKIPWKEIAKYAPIILGAAIKIKKTVEKHFFTKKSNISNPEEKTTVNNTIIIERINKLEENEVTQAELVKNIADQLNKLSIATEILSKRLFLALALSGIAIFLSIIMLIWKVI